MTSAVPRPGDVNAHTHLYSGLAELGLPDPSPPPEDFVQILERVWWRLDRAVDAGILRAGARWYVARALLGGTVGLIDHHESPGFIEGSLDVLADVCQDMGMRAVLCYGATERNGGADEAAAGLAECRRFIESNERPLVRGMVGLHASFTVSDETLRLAGELARDLDVAVHVHVAEDAADVDDARGRGYDGVVDRLRSAGVLVPGSILAHGVHLTPDEVVAAADAGCWFVQNPRSNENNRVGYPAALRHTARVALGTDGFPSDLAEELRALLVAGEEAGDERDALVERRARSAAVLADALGEAPSGDHVSRTRNGDTVEVVIGGRRLVQDGRLVDVDPDSLRRDAEVQHARLLERMENPDG